MSRTLIILYYKLRIYDVNASLLKENQIKGKTKLLKVVFDIEIFFDFSLTVKAAPRECVIRTGQP